MPIQSLLNRIFSKLKPLNTDNLTRGIEYLRKRFSSLPDKPSTKIHTVSRSVCIFRSFDLSQIPASNHRQALQLKINQWSPWPKFRTNIIVKNNFAQVWCWPDTPGSNKNLKNIVETRFFALSKSETEQLLLLRLEQGYEGQYWKQGILRESHWWPEKPSQSAWLKFQRSVGLPPTTDLPSIISELSPQPWGKDYSLEQNLFLILAERYFWLGLPTLVVFFLGWHSTQIYLLKNDLSSQNQQREALSRQIEPILKIRAGIQGDQQFLDQVVGLWKQSRQLTLLDQIIAKLPDPTTMKLVYWEYQANELRFTVNTDNPDPSLFVKAYSDLPWGQDVSAQPNPNGNEITIAVRQNTNGN